ncbi:MAG: hypothetical protein COY86_09085 [Rhodobacterales bacterium CG_4_10_14_0_8_um_filter_70_9]|nr:MAG: hypothetical protein COY86_09085 [Rhodobacterales bacterium CG_4_10_14_0_8_um_filter_70_9]
MTFVTRFRDPGARLRVCGRLRALWRGWGDYVMLCRLIVSAVLFATGVSAATLERIAETGVLRVGVRADAPPLSYLRDGAPSGYSVALCDRLAERLAEQMARPPLIVEPVVVTTEDRFTALAEGRIDILCGAASMTLARRAEVDFSIPVYIDGASVLMRSGETVDFSALANRRIGVRAGTTTERNLIATLDATNMVADVVTVAEHAEGVARLLGRDVDAYFADQSILLFLMVGSGRAEELTLARNVLTIEPQALALPLGDAAFRLEVDRALSRMYRAGEIAALFDENFAPATMGDAMKALTLIAPIPE